MTDRANVRQNENKERQHEGTTTEWNITTIHDRKKRIKDNNERHNEKERTTARQ